VRPLRVVEADEGVDEGLELGEGAGLVRLCAQPFLQRLLEAFDLALGLWVVGLAVLLCDVQLA
jgi:hypothetical protein